MDKELKQTLLAICQKYDIGSRYDHEHRTYEMWVYSNNAQIDLTAIENTNLQELWIELEVLPAGLRGYRYRGNVRIRMAEMLGRAAGVSMPGMSAEKQDLLDIYNAMRKNVDEQKRAASAVLKASQLQDLQRAFNIQLNEKNANVR